MIAVVSSGGPQIGSVNRNRPCGAQSPRRGSGIRRPARIDLTSRPASEVGFSPPAYPVFLPKTGDLALMVFQPKKSYAPDQAWTSVSQTLHSNLAECLWECSSLVAT